VISKICIIFLACILGSHLLTQGLVGDEHLPHEISGRFSALLVLAHVDDLGFVQGHLSVHVKMHGLEVLSQRSRVDHLILEFELSLSILKLLVSLIFQELQSVLLLGDGRSMLGLKKLLILLLLSGVVLESVHLLLSSQLFLSFLEDNRLL